MLNFSFKLQNVKKISSKTFFLILILSFISFIFLINFDSPSNDIYHQEKNDNYKDNKIPEFSALVGFINITNNEINNTRYYHNETVPICGRIYEVLNPNQGFPGLSVAIFINGTLYSQYNNETDGNGYFRINNFTIGFGFDIYSPHKIEVDIIEDTGMNDFVKINYLILFANATSYFDITLTRPAIPGEDYNTFNCFLRYDNGMGIPNKQINSTWYNESNKIGDNPGFNSSEIGFFSPILTIPNDNYSDFLFLNLSYFGNPPYINSSHTGLTINLFRNITCIWNIVSTASEGSQITISGQVLSSNNTNLIINNRAVDIYYSGTPITTTTTDQNGFFQFTYQVPSGTGNIPIDIEVVNNIGLNLRSNTTHYIIITSAIPSSTSSPSGKGGTADPPFFNFFLVFIPIIIGIVAGFSIYAYFYLKKQEEESKTIKVPLEGRIRNLKILKDTGRLEEALSYLFQSIYLELIQAKYNRVKKTTETIRDFAIISVKDLNLNPANIYPFIQNVEKIIYDKPFIINEADFYTAVDLFSPIYFELTGFNFILNF